MNMHFNMSDFEKARAWEAAVARGLVNPARFLNDFSSTLERELEKMVELIEPTWANPVTGRPATAIATAFNVLGFSPTKHWSLVVRDAKTFKSFHLRGDLPKGSSWPTACLDLTDVEALIVKTAPRKGPKVLKAFKEEHGLR